jgi:hypothetical protein
MYHDQRIAMNTVMIDGIEYAPVRKHAGERAVIVVDRGWIFAGDVERVDGRIRLTRAVWLFRWEKVGFAAVIDDPKKAKADVRPIADVDIPASSEIFCVPVGPGWGLNV